jgi:alkanesulfonate monooxygenase SsuD/methylene tetrahydromethanopterin reductase-like flavin-dependent oxidoreductase (luciferase family)
MTICHRHPIHLAQLGASLSAISGGRLILGMGLGGFAHEFAAAGWPTSLADRATLVKANIEVCRRLWNGENVSYLDPFFHFEKVSLKPTPIKEIPIWIGGGTAAACRRAAAMGDGWMPARVTLATFASRISYLRDLCSTMGRPMITTAVMPLTSLGRTLESALTGIDVKTVVDESRRFTPWIKAPADSYSESDGPRGLLLAGTPADIIRDTHAFADAGADHVIYDLRLRFADWRKQLKLLGKEVLPAFAENSADQS